jgi:hypothetical protein
MTWLAALLCAWTAVAGDARLLAPPGRLFEEQTILELRLEAPLQTLFAARAADDFHVTGRVADASRGPDPLVLNDVEISVRGHTSRRDTECTFPKLKLKFQNAKERDGSVFAGVESLKIGTHCGELPEGQLTAKFGRLANERSPLRESAVYALLAAIGIPAPRARPARITYVDTDAIPPRPLIRYALLLEDDDDLLVRLGARAEVPMERFSSARERFAPVDAARVALAEAMIGNFDWCLRFTPDDTYRCDATTPLWNVMALERADGTAFPVIKDFDLAGMVTGAHPWFGTVYVRTFVSSQSAIDVEVLSQVQRTRSLFTRAVLDSARRGFLDRRRAAADALARATLDPVGRSLAGQYLKAFYDAIGSDAAFYRRVVVKPDTRLYLDANRTAEACRPGDAIPPGTPVNELSRAGTMLRVQVLDALWHWAPPAHCPAVRQGDVWIDADSVSADFPSGTPR